MTKGDQTRLSILAKAAQVFSVRGYASASMDDLMRATGLTKGGIYHHFGSKDALAIEAFDFAVDIVQEKLEERLIGKTNAVDRLNVYVDLFYCLIDDPIIKGGCPILNAAVEADDTNPVLCERVQRRMDGWRTFLTSTVEQGQKENSVRQDIQVDSVVTVIIATLEGAIMMSKLYADKRFLDHAVAHLRTYISTLANTGN